MQEHLDLTDAMQAQALRVRVQLAPHRNRWIGDAGVAPLAAEARVARRLARAHTAKERLEGQINPYCDVLQDLRLDICQGRSGGFERGHRRLLVVEAQRLLPLLPGLAPSSQQLQSATHCRASGIPQAEHRGDVVAVCSDTGDT